MENVVDEVYSSSRLSLPIFKFETDLWAKIVQKEDGERDKHQCLAKTNGTFTTNNCNSKKSFVCKGGLYGFGTWSNAIYNCTVTGSLLKKENDDSDHWLKYFKYKEEKANEQCVAIVRTNNSRSLTYEYRSCSERLPVLCVNQSYSSHINTPELRNQGREFPASPTELDFERTIWPTLTNMSDVERPVVEKIVVVNVVLFGLCSLFVVLIIFRKRLALQVCPKANQKLRRNNINTKPVVQRDGNNETNKEKCQNENNMDRDNYVEPWEMRQNIVHMDEPCSQDSIDVETEETET
ncbi:uncharacterized protein LOC143046570 [Mytilus galloprovincialis]|uniref:uncharacterized protein LOC143046570 n=1 Tax=Mytilus galloprovincialis TaxID=29158 RepID=UPI003F7BDEFC